MKNVEKLKLGSGYLYSIRVRGRIEYFTELVESTWHFEYRENEQVIKLEELADVADFAKRKNISLFELAKGNELNFTEFFLPTLKIGSLITKETRQLKNAFQQKKLVIEKPKIEGKYLVFYSEDIINLVKSLTKNNLNLEDLSLERTVIAEGTKLQPGYDLPFDCELVE